MFQSDQETAAEAAEYRRREARARRRARRQGLVLCKSRRDGSYMLVDAHRNGAVVEGYGVWLCEFGLWLDDVEAALS